MRGLAIIGLGQFVSILGTGLTQFALIVWVWGITKSAAPLTILAAFTFIPSLILAPIAGSFIDRWDRKLTMMLSDLAAAVATVTIFFLYTSQNLQIWHLYVTGAFTGAFQAFQWPAYSAAIATMVHKNEYSRANGVLSLAESASGIAAPLLAGVLVGAIGLGNILLIDLFTFVFALGTLIVVYIPSVTKIKEKIIKKTSIWKDALFGFKYIARRRGLLGIQIVLLGWNLVANFSNVILSPMILARTGNNPATLGTVLTFGSLGMLSGGLAMSVWRGPQRHIHGILIGCTLGSVFGLLITGIGRSLPIWAISSFLGFLFSPVINNSNQSIWQAKIPLAIQGRVFAARRTIAALAIPLAFLTSGLMADRIFEPAMQSGGKLAKVFGGLVGVGPGAGMGLMMVISGILGIALGLTSYLIPTIRDVEITLPDHNQSLSPS